jgi:hypothetical protein
MLFMVLGLGVFLSGFCGFSGAGGFEVSGADAFEVSEAGGPDAAFGSWGEELWL